MKRVTARMNENLTRCHGEGVWISIGVPLPFHQVTPSPYHLQGRIYVRTT